MVPATRSINSLGNRGGYETNMIPMHFYGKIMKSDIIDGLCSIDASIGCLTR